MEPRNLAGRLSAINALEDSSRRALYEFVVGTDEPISRDAAAAALGLTRSTAAFQLDRLADEGLLTVEFRRLTGRSGPGAGRPAKLYRRTDTEVAVSVPERDYELAGDILATAVEESIDSGEPIRTAVRRIARGRGQSIGADADNFEKALESEGYEPRTESGGDIVMDNCPFHRLAQRHVDVICELNFELLRGMVDGSDECGRTIVSEPGAGRCCVRALPDAG